ncbi:MAG: gamma-glutamylcyclotransferase [Alphaproteobacteria bacterium]
MDRDLWIFGYGSLIWRPDFSYAERKPATIAGWTRRFWQGSTDHRGVPDAPGRVVTLVPSARAICWGMAYRIAAQETDAVLSHLDYREKGGYRVERVALKFGRPADIAEGLVYIATPDNPNYLGPAPPAAIARQVRASAGPSGPNDEYVLRLADALREFGVRDEHVFAVERHVRREAENP